MKTLRFREALRKHNITAIMYGHDQSDIRIVEDVPAEAVDKEYIPDHRGYRSSNMISVSENAPFTVISDGAGTLHLYAGGFDDFEKELTEAIQGFLDKGKAYYDRVKDNFPLNEVVCGLCWKGGRIDIDTLEKAVAKAGGVKKLAKKAANDVWRISARLSYESPEDDEYGEFEDFEDDDEYTLSFFEYENGLEDIDHLWSWRDRNLFV